MDTILINGFTELSDDYLFDIDGGKINWNEVGKEMSQGMITGAVTGAVTGAITGGIGGALESIIDQVWG